VTLPSRSWTILLSTGLLVGGFALGCSQDRPAPTTVDLIPRPNVLLISLDTLRADHLGCFGYSKGTSPNLDKFAAGAIRFSNCRSQAPWTLPSHMSLFTSMLPTDNTVDNINRVLPSHLITLAQVLQKEGYRTVARVNDGQMKQHWGFGRGFDKNQWLEYPVNTPEGSCKNITDQALAFFKVQSAETPFFLFLHYYDPHDPYDAPEPFRRRLGATLSGAEASKLCQHYRTPEHKLRPDLLGDLVAAYDAEIAWLDDELGRLLAAVPPNTVVVVFSDHGEAFKEHGWLLHGATLYEEEVHVPLLVRLPNGRVAGKVIDEPVMLLDVAPTILAGCGIGVPKQFQGLDLAPLWQGGQLPKRLILAETKAVLEGRYCLSATLYPLKGIYSLFDGRFELYKLPDEQKDLAGTDVTAAEALRKPLRQWMEAEQFWMVHAVGLGDYEATLETSKEGFGLYIPVGMDAERDDLESEAQGRILRWHVYPGKDRPKSLFLQPAQPDAALRVNFKVNGAEETQLIFLGKDGKHPAALPATLTASLAPVSPYIDRPFKADKPGFYVHRHRTPGSRPRSGRVAPLDEGTLKQLRSLGYVH
jgi:arylsulfatase A-like enzyme